LLLRLLLPPRRVERAITRAAELAFFEHAVFATRERTGVLIFLSALEHRVIILGDEGIHARVHETGWQELVTTLVAAIKAGRAGDGVCEVIRKLGATLAEAAPVRADDVDELDNRVRGH
jgi:putative membrane protein